MCALWNDMPTQTVDGTEKLVMSRASYTALKGKVACVALAVCLTKPLRSQGHTLGTYPHRTRGEQSDGRLASLPISPRLFVTHVRGQEARQILGMAGWTDMWTVPRKHGVYG